jgi:hypothetical protein
LRSLFALTDVAGTTREKRRQIAQSYPIGRSIMYRHGGGDKLFVDDGAAFGLESAG